MSNARQPTLVTERALFAAGHKVVAGMDEVGRGALAGPVAVGVFALDAASEVPAQVRDSKAIGAARRQAVATQLATCGLAQAVGYASAREVDQWGIIVALRAAALRALADLHVPPDIIILDGKHNWLSAGSLFDAVQPPYPGPVHMQVKADRDCASVAAASVLAKVSRDAYMTAAAAQFPAYAWERNKGYGSSEHLAAIATHGLSRQHRASWRIRTCTDGP